MIDTYNIAWSDDIIRGSSDYPRSSDLHLKFPNHTLRDRLEHMRSIVSYDAQGRINVTQSNRLRGFYIMENKKDLPNDLVPRLNREGLLELVRKTDVKTEDRK